MDIHRHNSVGSTSGSADYFTGSVQIASSFKGTPPARISGAVVTFQPGARTAWHTHPLGQTLFVLAGNGWAQRAGAAVEEIRPGDIIHFAPGEKHWHGATPNSTMTHLAVAEQLDGKVVDWMEHVTDEQYRK